MLASDRLSARLHPLALQMTRIPSFVFRTVLLAACFLATAGLSSAADALRDRGASATDAGAVAVDLPERSLVGDLYPGGSGALTVRLTNPHSVPMIVTHVEPSGDRPVGTSKPACDAEASAVRLVPQRGLLLVLAPRTTRTVTFPAAVTMGRKAPDACQGAAFTFAITVTAVSAH